MGTSGTVQARQINETQVSLIRHTTSRRQPHGFEQGSYTGFEASDERVDVIQHPVELIPTYVKVGIF